MNIEMIDSLSITVVDNKNKLADSVGAKTFYEQCQEALDELQQNEVKTQESGETETAVSKQETIEAQDAREEETESEEVEKVNLFSFPWLSTIQEGTFALKGEGDLVEVEASLEFPSFKESPLMVVESETLNLTMDRQSLTADLISLKESLKVFEQEVPNTMELPELEDGQFPELKWETNKIPSLLEDLSTSKAGIESGTLLNSETDSFLSGGWSAQVLSQKAEELGVEAPEAGLSQRINELLSQVSQLQEAAQGIGMPSVEKGASTEVNWSQRDLLMERLMNQLSMMQEGDSSKLSLTLVPKHLGTMQLEFEMVQGQLRGRIVTESKEVAQWMEKAIQSLSSETLSLKTVQVETQTQMGSFGFGQEQMSQGQKESQLTTKDLEKGSYLSEEEEESISPLEIDQDVRLIL